MRTVLICFLAFQLTSRFERHYDPHCLYMSFEAMAQVTPKRPSGKPLITYSRKATRLLPLDGTQFLNLVSTNSVIDTTTLPAQQHDDQSPLDLIEFSSQKSNTNSTPRTPSTSPSMVFKNESSRWGELTMVPSGDFDPSIFASPLSESDYNEHDSIVDEQHSVARLNLYHENLRARRAPRVPLSVARKALLLPTPHRSSAVTAQTGLPQSTADRAAITRGSDGFTSSELFVPMKSAPVRRRIRKTRVARHAKRVATATLATQKGPHPDVDFLVSNMVVIKPIPTPSPELMTPMQEEVDGHAVTVSVSTRPQREVTFSDRVVYAQLSSIQAPVRSEQSVYSISDDSESDGYQTDPLDSEQDFSGLDHDDHKSTPRSVRSADCDQNGMEITRPGRIPRQLTVALEWIGVEEDMADMMGTSNFLALKMPANTAVQEDAQPRRQNSFMKIGSNRSYTLSSRSRDAIVGTMAQQPLPRPQVDSKEVRVESEMLDDFGPLTSTVEDQHLYSARPNLLEPQAARPDRLQNQAAESDFRQLQEGAGNFGIHHS